MKQPKLRVGVIGAGSVVREIYQHLFFRSAYSSHLSIAAVAARTDADRNWLGDLAKLPKDRRYRDYKEMLEVAELDAVQVNTPDDLHCAPAVAALQAGLDVIVPKPLASSVKDAHQMIQAARSSQRFLGVDFHKRWDPRIREAGARFQTGRYGAFQAAVFYMLDKLLVANPNHSPRFFASQNFAEKNSPISFLTVHMVDALIQIIQLAPRYVRATAHAHKLPTLKPVPVNGHDLVDTEIVFKNGGTAHVLTGWALPNSAWSTTVQSARIICSEGLVDLRLDTPGLRETVESGVSEVNPLFRNFTSDGQVSGYGIESPGRLYQEILARRQGEMTAESFEAALSPMALGFHATLVLQAAQRSLERGQKIGPGTTSGAMVDLSELLREQLGSAAASEYYLAGGKLHLS